MDLKSGYPWWAVRNGLIHAFPPLQQDLRCDVLVVGGGITGALIADELSRHGHDVAVIEQRDIGQPGTALAERIGGLGVEHRHVDVVAQLAARHPLELGIHRLIGGSRIGGIKVENGRSGIVQGQPVGPGSGGEMSNSDGVPRLQ